MLIKQKLHDGMTFFWTSFSASGYEQMVGFYVDRLGCLQEIYRSSLYGDYILDWEKETSVSEAPKQGCGGKCKCKH